MMPPSDPRNTGYTEPAPIPGDTLISDLDPEGWTEAGVKNRDAAKRSNLRRELLAEAKFNLAIEAVRRGQKASTAFLMQELQIDYNQAGQIVEKMEGEGLVGPPNHVGEREIFYDSF